jgi:hypothetical protein
MLRTPNALLLCSLATLAFLSQAKAQSTSKADDALKAVLLKRGDEFMSAWKKHDSAGIASILGIWESSQGWTPKPPELADS